MVKNLPANAEDASWIPRLGRAAGEGTTVSLPGKSHGQGPGEL